MELFSFGSFKEKEREHLKTSIQLTKLCLKFNCQENEMSKLVSDKQIRSENQDGANFTLPCSYMQVYSLSQVMHYDNHGYLLLLCLSTIYLPL